MKEENRRLKKEIEQKKEDNELILKTLENYENKILNAQKTAESLQKTMKDNKDRMEEALIERDKILIRQEQFEKMMDSLKANFAEEKEQEKEKNEKLMDITKQKHQAFLAKKEEEINILNDQIANFNIQIEKLTKDNKSMKIEISKMNNNLIEDLNKNDEKYKQIVLEKNQMEIKFEQEMHDLYEKMKTLTIEKESLDRMINNQKEVYKQLKEDYEKLREYDNSLELEIKDAKQKNQKLLQDRQNVLDECEKMKKIYEDQLTNEQKRLNLKEKTLIETNKNLKESKIKCAKLFNEIDKVFYIFPLL